MRQPIIPEQLKLALSVQLLQMVSVRLYLRQVPTQFDSECSHSRRRLGLLKPHSHQFLSKDFKLSMAKFGPFFQMTLTEFRPIYLPKIDYSACS